MTLKIGDRVKVIKNYDSARIGMTGIIKHLNSIDAAVEFDKEFSGGHDCDGNTVKNRGHWVGFDCLELIKEEITMKKMICVKNDGYEDRLTIGKIYKITPAYDNYVDTVGDDGVKLTVYNYRFKDIPEWVEEPEILDEHGNTFIQANYNLVESYKNIDNLKKGRSFWIPRSAVFGIDSAVKLRDWLNDMIDIAASTGYFEEPEAEEMTIEEIQKALGKKIKIVESRAE